MRKYIIQFWYNTDLKQEILLETPDELSALVLAKLQLNLAEDWVTAKPFEIKIKQG